VKVAGVRGESLGAGFDWVISRAVKPADVIRVAKRIGASVALLVGREDAVKLEGFQVVDLPWGENRVLATFHVKHSSKPALPRST
jgi:hypothetical protein